MLTDYFFSAQNILISPNKFSTGKWTEIQKLQICSCCLWEEEICTHQICKIYQNVEKSIDWQLWIFTSLFNCLKSVSWETSLDLAAIQVEDYSSFSRRLRKLKCVWYIKRKKGKKKKLGEMLESYHQRSWKFSVPVLGKLKEEKVQGNLELSSSNAEKLNIINWYRLIYLKNSSLKKMNSYIIENRVLIEGKYTTGNLPKQNTFDILAK